MNPLRFLLVIVLFSLPINPVTAQSIPIRSGDHGSFSRLVLSSDLIKTWTVRDGVGSKIIEFGSYNGTFDTRSIFDRIDRKRIAEVSVENSSLQLALSCNCTLKIFKHENNWIVIDVHEPEIPYQVNPIAEPSLVHLGKGNKLSFTHLKQTPKSKSKLRDDFYRFARIDTEQSKNILVLESLQRAQKTLLANLNEELMRGFGYASTQGLLQTTDWLPVERSDVQLSTETLSQLNEIGINSIVRNTGDLSQKNASVNTNRNSSPNCNLSEHLRFSDWSNGQSLLAQLGAHHAELFDALEKPNIDATVKLALLYLSFGFGAEAKKILSTNIIIQKRWPELLVVADLVEGKPRNQPPFFVEESGCGGLEILWISLFNDSDDDLIVKKQNEILLMLSTMPVELRLILAPRISARFLKTGNLKSAQAALRTLERTESSPNETTQLERAAILADLKQPEKSIKVLNGITGNSSSSARALVRKANLLIETGLEVDEPTQHLLQSLAPEFKGTALGQDLDIVSVLILSKASKFRQALSEVTQIDLSKKSDVLLAIYNDIVNHSDDEYFAIHVFEESDETLISQNAPLSLEFSKRLFELGFIQKSFDVLERVPQDQRSENFKITHAEIAIALGEIDVATEILASSKHKKTHILQTLLYTKQNRYAQAGEMYRALNSPDKKWLKLRLTPFELTNLKGESELMRQLSKIADMPLVQSSNYENLLKETEHLLSESKRTRTTLPTVLALPNIDLQAN